MSTQFNKKRLPANPKALRSIGRKIAPILAPAVTRQPWLNYIRWLETGTVFADQKSKRARILIDHPHAYRDWTIVGPASERGFWHLRSSFRLTAPSQVPDYSTFELCLHESEFERL
jgi:hypothetical protein